MQSPATPRLDAAPDMWKPDVRAQAIEVSGFEHSDLCNSQCQPTSKTEGSIDMPYSDEFQSFLVERLFQLKDALVSEIQASKEECAAAIQASSQQCWSGIDGLRTTIEKSHISLQESLQRQNYVVQKQDAPAQGEGHRLDFAAQKLGKAEMDVQPLEDTSGQKEDLWLEVDQERAENKKVRITTVSDGVKEGHTLYKPILDGALDKGSAVHKLFRYCGIYFAENPPKNCLAKVTEHPIFIMFQTTAIIANTVIMGYETDELIKASLQQPPGQTPKWLDTCNIVFNIIFIVELLFRIIALRSWFFIAPTDWAWNMFDALIVACSILTDFVLQDIQLSFLRFFRLLRAIRATRVMRIFRFFRQLRKMFFAILASLGALMWFFLFLTMIMFMTAILLLQGLASALDNIDSNSIPERSEIQHFWGSVSSAMYSLLSAVSGGMDWMDIGDPLEPAGTAYMFVFLFYILFVTVGVINVLTGLFLQCNEDYDDQSLTVINEMTKLECQVSQMLDVFEDVYNHDTGKVGWEAFQNSMRCETVQAFLASHDLEPEHALLIFRDLDVENAAEVNISDLVMRMLRYRGDTKAMDTQILKGEVRKVLKLLESNVGVASRGMITI